MHRWPSTGAAIRPSISSPAWRPSYRNQGLSERGRPVPISRRSSIYAARERAHASPSLQRDFELLSTVPGVGEKTAWLMIVILTSRPFKSAAEVASFLGLNPIEKRSGKSEYRKPRLSKSGSAHYRQALYFPAMVATRKNPDVQALYERLVEAGRPKMCALGAAMRKLVHICYGVYKNQQPYQPQVSVS